jgi:hypothetical protein
MSNKKKYLSMALVLSATALTSVVASGGQTPQNSQSKRERPNDSVTRSEIETKEHITALVASLSGLLGVHGAMLLEKINSGMSPREIIKELGFNELYVQKKIAENYIQEAKEHLLAKVKNGELTLTKAGDILARMKSNLAVE